jgi:uncharacterized protein YecE (DUF72 family)
VNPAGDTPPPAPPAESLPGPDRLQELARAVPDSTLFGTSSWTYPGWAGMVYHREYPKTGSAAQMLEEYARFPLFRTVGIDSSFYAPPTPEQLHHYAQVLPPGFRCVSKVWDRLTVLSFPKARYRAQGGEPNPDFLNADVFLDEILGPSEAYFSDHIGPFVFEFQTIAKREGIDPLGFADRLDRFFSRLPREHSYAVEVRNREFLEPPYFAVLREHNVAHVFNSWTRMPPVGYQIEMPGAFTAPFTIARILLRPGRSYSEAVDAFAPYDRIQDRNLRLRQDIVRLIRASQKLRIPAYVLVNNRAEGSAPITIAAVAAMLEEDVRRET